MNVKDFFALLKESFNRESLTKQVLILAAAPTLVVSLLWLTIELVVDGHLVFSPLHEVIGLTYFAFFCAVAYMVLRKRSKTK